MALSRPHAFLRQARSDFLIFNHLLAQDRGMVPECHPLHYLQMSTEKLAKAILESLGVTLDRWTHVAFSHLPHRLARADIGRALGYEDWRAYRTFLKRSSRMFREIDELSPAVGAQRLGGGMKEGPNAEYPWPGRDKDGRPAWIAPVQHDFLLLEAFRHSREGAQVLNLVRTLLDRFEEVFG